MIVPEGVLCGSTFSKDAKLLKVTGNKNSVDVNPSSVMAIKISGNKNSVTVKIRAEIIDEETNSESDASLLPSLDGLCFLMSGNRAKVDVVVENFRLKKFSMFARGNQPEASLEVKEEGVVDEIAVDIKGNGGSLSVSGDGDFTCPALSLKTKGGSISCEEKEEADETGDSEGAPENASEN